MHPNVYQGACIARVRKDNLQKGGRKAMDWQVEAVHYVYTCSHKCVYLSVYVKIVYRKGDGKQWGRQRAVHSAYIYVIA